MEELLKMSQANNSEEKLPLTKEQKEALEQSIAKTINSLFEEQQKKHHQLMDLLAKTKKEFR
jgi:hypothetical protein